ncbi:cytochrome c oxidase subunit IV-domain-containing protein, partial [Limtongia smithiae]|uniref:cytochrome c oxidase subunit IV-domain-containing protein n=1 Tax=Limtongia smithiae TaxID=1125753 RepID=UPI0034CD21A0
SSVIRPASAHLRAFPQLPRMLARFNSTAAPAAATSHAIATPLIVDLPTRWETLPVDEQVDITMKIWERQKQPWSDLTLDEKRASFFISYGPWGPRKPMHGPYDTYKIIGGTLLGVAASVMLFALARQFAGPEPKTMTREWQEA